MSYNDPPEELCKQMMDLFFLVGEKAILFYFQISNHQILLLSLHQNEILTMIILEKQYLFKCIECIDG